MVLYGDNKEQIEKFFSRNDFSDYELSACLGYFNIRGWNELLSFSDIKKARILLGLPRNDTTLVSEFLQNPKIKNRIDDKLANDLKQDYIKKIKNQLQLGAPTFEEKEALIKLREGIDNGNIQIKLFTENRLHAKLYIISDENKNDALLGSSNLTFSGIDGLGELNVDLKEDDLSNSIEWFEEKWNSRFSLDITPDLNDLIAKSWASDEILDPYLVYLKVVYLLSKDAREGLVDYSIPNLIEKDLLEFQKNAIEIASKYLQKQNGIMIGDAVGFGKTIEAIGLAGLLQQQYGWGTLIICPPNLVEMWTYYVEKYELIGTRIEPLSSKLTRSIGNLKRFHLLIIDESHNLRTGKRQEYSKIVDYIKENESKVVLLTATPYNKDFSDVFNQIKLFQDPNADLGYKPLNAINKMGIPEAAKISEGLLSNLNFFEKALKTAPNEEDMQVFMSNFLIRRTRKFLADNYAIYDKEKERNYFLFSDGEKYFIPNRVPSTLNFKNSELGEAQALLRSEKTIEQIDELNLPRYRLKNYLKEDLDLEKIKDKDLNEFLTGVFKLGNNVYNFNKTFLYKRLSSSEYAFLISAKRRVNSDSFWIWCLSKKLDIPVGTIDSDLLDNLDSDIISEIDHNSSDFEIIYKEIKETNPSWVKAWMPVSYFNEDLKKDLNEDTQVLSKLNKETQNEVLQDDKKIEKLIDLINNDISDKKILIFSEFKDTVLYIKEKLDNSIVNKRVEAVSSETPNLNQITKLFSPTSNNYVIEVGSKEEIDILISTDVLSDGKILQDANIVINYVLPLTIINIILFA